MRTRTIELQREKLFKTIIHNKTEFKNLEKKCKELQNTWLDIQNKIDEITGKIIDRIAKENDLTKRQELKKQSVEIWDLKNVANSELYYYQHKYILEVIESEIQNIPKDIILSSFKDASCNINLSVRIQKYYIPSKTIDDDEFDEYRIYYKVIDIIEEEEEEEIDWDEYEKQMDIMIQKQKLKKQTKNKN